MRQPVLYINSGSMSVQKCWWSWRHWWRGFPLVPSTSSLPVYLPDR